MPAGASTLAQVSLSPPVDGRLGVAKTYKLYVGGAFPRSESGRSYPVTDIKGRLLAHAALASRKDVRDAVSAARAALPGWSGATAYNRGQVLYRVAEMLQARREGFVDDVVAAEGIGRKRAGAVVDTAVDRWVWYAGWTDKIATVLGSVNPVAGPYVNFSTPVPTGVIGVLAPAGSALTGLVDVLAPVLATGCTPNADSTVWTCKLRENVKFADGATFDANDVVVSYASQWDTKHPLHKGRTTGFDYWPALFGGFLNPPPA